MNKLFIIDSKNEIRKDYSPKLCIRTNQMDKQNVNLELSLSHNNSESSISSKKIMKVPEERFRKQTSINILSTEPSFDANLNSNSNYIIGNMNEKEFIGKKTKFKVNKVSKEKNRNKFVIYNFENLLKKKTESLNLEELNSPNKSKNKKNKYKNLNLNEGRWSEEEHHKFMKAVVDHGKNWKVVQKCVVSRDIAQTRSHAQKFVIRLKSIKNEKFDLSSEKINNIIEIIKVIKDQFKGDNKEKEKQYIYDSLLYLDRINPGNKKQINRNSTNNNISRKDNNINNEKNNKNEIDNNNNILNKDKFKIVKENNNLETNNKKNEQTEEQMNKQLLKEKEMFKGEFLNKEEDEQNENGLLENCNIEEGYNNDYSEYYYSEPVKDKYVFHDGYIYNIDDAICHNYNILSTYKKNYNFVYNSERSNFINRNFFS